MSDIPETEYKLPVQVKVSRLAITAIGLAFCGLIFFCIGFISLHLSIPFPVSSRARSSFADIFFFMSLLSLIFALILGFISLTEIEKSGGRKTGRNFAVGAILISLLGSILPIAVLFLARTRCIAFRMVCGTQLSGMGRSMLMYANDYDDEFPRVGGRSTIAWGTSVKWDALTRQQAYNLNPDGTGGEATVSSFLYLLVKYAEVPPERFICKFDRKVSKFDPAKYNMAGKDITQFWDFGPEPWKHNSYSYQMPNSSNFLITSSEPGMAVMADRNPWIPSVGWKVKDFTAFNPDGDRKAKMAGNSFPHDNEGQNVLFLDSHVNFETISFCGINEDNIYTFWEGEDIRKGVMPVLGSEPADKLDSLLVNDPPAKKP